ncbi:MAG: peptidoglycan synthetase [Bacteroidetes bacterium]|nr:MAG: peptidoglycan synthetase [Bacteroidota bacterium]
MSKIHFIAIGGSAMHNLAIALHLKGYEVSGSDDEIFEPSKSRLKKYNILPSTNGWNIDKITPELDAIIVGMHARIDNPELLKAQKLGLKIFSYPEFLYEQSKDKTRIVIGGSHGKTTITSMILHVMQDLNIETDYMVGAKLEGFEVMVKLTDSAKYMVIEGDEYLTSPIDRRPKFHLYMPHIALLSGIAWDHINVFPTFDNYVSQFSTFINLIDKNGALIYCKEDDELNKIAKEAEPKLLKYPYGIPEHRIDDNGITHIKIDNIEYALKVFGDHNLMNLNGAQLVCQQIGINKHDFYKSISSFKGASNRLELIGENANTKVFKDFAHSPSKLMATTSAMKHQFKKRKLVACMELHTFSSLSADFLSHYKGAMDDADIAIVYFNPHTIAHKKLPEISVEQVKDGFANKKLLIFTESNKLQNYLKEIDYSDKNLLIMTSGNLDGVNLGEFAKEIIDK